MTVHIDHESPAGTDEPEPASTAEEPPERLAAKDGLLVDLTLGTGVAARLGGAAIDWLHEHARKAGVHLELTGELRVRIVGDAEMAAAHERHLGDPTTTDVMTFDLAEGASADGEPVDTDLLVCLDEAQRRADEHGHAVERELLLYTIHGLMHCLGEDDDDQAAYERMHAREDELLEAIGVGATFAPKAGATERSA